MLEMGFTYWSIGKSGIWVPCEKPEGKTKYDVSAVEQLEMYKLFMENYTEHNCSNTIHVEPHEWKMLRMGLITGLLVGLLSYHDSFYH